MSRKRRPKKWWDRCKALLKLLTLLCWICCSLSFPIESTIRLRTCEGTDLRSFISHIKLSSENKTRVDKNEKLRRPHTEDLNHQLFKLLSVLDTVSKTLKMLSYFRATKISNVLWISIIYLFSFSPVSFTM